MLAAAVKVYSPLSNTIFCTHVHRK